MEQPTTHQKPVHEYFCIKSDDQVTYIHALKYIIVSALKLSRIKVGELILFGVQ